MAVRLRDLLMEPLRPFDHFYVSGIGNSSSKKAWAIGYEDVLPPYLTLTLDPSLDEIQQALGAEDEQERFLLSKTVHPLNPTAEDLQSEGDTRRVFYTRIALPVQLAFEQMLKLRSEVGPSGPTNCRETADFSWVNGEQCALVGEFKRHSIIHPKKWTGEETADANRILLGRELRGYCDKYKTTAAALFDGEYLILLIFNPDEKQSVTDEKCPVLGFIFHYTSPRLRYCLFRVASFQLRRCRA
ncbi:hypothetical protein F5Y01DRAFT_320827 [Xylaria sp. FL0043]|nr:hypothetical protein F5Y01DRAFT_320827 [Xylaria sp. FL0043]